MARGVEIGRGYIAVDTEDEGARERLKSFGAFAAKALGVAAVGAGILTGAVAAVGVQFESMKEQAQVAFTTLLGSGEAATKMLTDLQRFSAQTPFEMEGLINNARGLLGVGVAADQVIPTLTALGNAAGALGLSQEAFDRIMLATTQSMAKGKIQGEELLQFAENGIPIFDLLGKALGVPKDQIAELGSQGKLLSAEVFPKLFAQMQKDYGGAMAAQSKTLAGTWSSLKDNARILAGTGFKPVFDQAKRVVGALGELAGSDKATTFAQRFAGALEIGISKARAFGNELRLQFRGEAVDTLEVATDRLKSFWNRFSAAAKDALSGVGTVIKQIAPDLDALAGSTGGLLGPALDAAARAAASFAANAEGIGRAISTAMGIVSGVAGPALAVLRVGLELTAVVLDGILSLVASAPGFFGTLAGVLAASVLAWRLLGGSIADVTKVLTVFTATGAVASGLQGVASKIDDAALSAGVLTERLTGSSKAGMKVAEAGGAIGGVFRGLTGFLPALGIGLAAIGALFATVILEQQQIKSAAEGIARGLSEGGRQARDAAGNLGRLKSELAGVEAEQRRWNASLEATQAGADDVYGGQLGDKVFDLKRRIAEVDTQFNDLVATLGPVEAAQARYNRAVAEYGPESREAAGASAAWRSALADEKLKNEQAAAATKTHLDRLLELQAAQLNMLNTDIGYRQSLAQLEVAQARVADAYNRSGVGSREYKDAVLAEEQAIAGLIDAAGRHAAAQAASQGPQAQSTAAMNAQNQEALRLLATLGTAAPASLRTFVANMDQAALAALDATNRTGNFNRVVVELSPGKTVTLAVNAETGEVIDFSRAVNAVVNRRDVQLNVVVSSSGDVRALDALGRPAGLTARAIGGYTPPGAVLVGEYGPEIRFEDRASYIATAAQTRRLLDPSGGGVGEFVGTLVLEDGTLMGRIRGVVQQEMNQTAAAIAHRRVF